MLILRANSPTLINGIQGGQAAWFLEVVIFLIGDSSVFINRSSSQMGGVWALRVFEYRTAGLGTVCRRTNQYSLNHSPDANYQASFLFITESQSENTSVLSIASRYLSELIARYS